MYACSIIDHVFLLIAVFEVFYPYSDHEYLIRIHLQIKQLDFLSDDMEDPLQIFRHFCRFYRHFEARFSDIVQLPGFINPKERAREYKHKQCRPSHFPHPVFFLSCFGNRDTGKNLLSCCNNSKSTVLPLGWVRFEKVLHASSSPSLSHDLFTAIPVVLEEISKDMMT